MHGQKNIITVVCTHERRIRTKTIAFVVLFHHTAVKTNL